MRNVQSKLERVEDKAAAAANKRNMEGNNLKHNSFDALSDPVLILRAIKMGVDIPDSDFSNIDILRELERTRNRDFWDDKEVSKNDNSNTLLLTNGKGDQTPLDMKWSE